MSSTMWIDVDTRTVVDARREDKIARNLLRCVEILLIWVAKAHHTCATDVKRWPLATHPYYDQRSLYQSCHVSVRSVVSSKLESNRDGFDQLNFDAVSILYGFDACPPGSDHILATVQRLSNYILEVVKPVEIKNRKFSNQLIHKTVDTLRDRTLNSQHSTITPQRLITSKVTFTPK